MIKIIRCTSEKKDFVELVKQLDSDLANRNGDKQSFYTQFNKLDKINHVVIAYENDIPMGCGAIKEYNNKTMEIKRMFCLPQSRRKGIASMILSELEKWAKELSYEKCILETGTKQPEAIGMYIRNKYTQIQNYGQYIGIEESRCFEKLLER